MFTDRIKRKAREGYREVVLPALKLAAKDLARRGLDRLLRETERAGLTGQVVRVDYGEYTETAHLDTLEKLIRKHVPIDVKVGCNRHGSEVNFSFREAKIYASGTGTRNYHKPLYRIQTCDEYLVYTNLAFLKRKGSEGLEIEAFQTVGKFLNLSDTEKWTVISLNGGHNYEPPDLGIKTNYLTSFMYLADILLRFAQRYPQDILDLHRNGDPAKVYSQLDFQVINYPGHIWKDSTAEAGVAKLKELLEID